MKALMDDYTGLGTPDDKKEIKVPKRLERILKDFKRVLDGKNTHVSYEHEFPQKLSPEQISQFISGTLKHESNDYHYRPLLAEIVCHLVKTSSAAGHTGFHLNLPEATDPYDHFDNLFRFLKAKRKGFSNHRRINMHVVGDVGHDFGSHSVGIDYQVEGCADYNFGDHAEHCTYTISGPVGVNCGAARDSSFTLQDTGFGCGRYSKECTYVIKGDTDWGLGGNSKGSTFHVHGNAGPGVADKARGSTFYFHGNIVNITRDEYNNPHDCKFIAYTKQTYEILKEFVAPGNRIKFRKGKWVKT